MNKGVEGDREPLSRKIGSSEQRKLKARKQSIRNIWFGFSLFGLVGWSVAIPTLVGIAFGIWIDNHYPSSRSWTLMLLVAGLCIGCWNAWRWMLQEKEELDKEEDNEH
ncbi:MAG: AtpZ/AtpI family protein [Candidatus Chlorobium antarcticum]|jgi:ATP synthase protein I|nr:AtpZ/AtpI family protein [Candidatus Chlorobium antarcticum]